MRVGVFLLAARFPGQSDDEVLAATEPFDVATLETAIHTYAESHGHPMGQVVNPLRVATTGQGVGPGLYDCLAILGRESCRTGLYENDSIQKRG